MAAASEFYPARYCTCPAITQTSTGCIPVALLLLLLASLVYQHYNVEFVRKQGSSVPGIFSFVLIP
jgi:hypothetical protein